jgi:hypothetical protein
LLKVQKLIDFQTFMMHQNYSKKRKRNEKRVVGDGGRGVG